MTRIVCQKGPFLGIIISTGKESGTMSTKTNIFILCAALALLIFLPGKNDACAGGGTIATQTCDTGVWTAMSRRAQLEAEREVMQNQNLIFKADSVLTYTCFDNFAAHAALNTGRIFTHTGFFGPPPVNWGAPNGMDNAMQNVVINSMRPYIDTNFGHAKLGGRGQLIAPNPAMAPHVVEPIGSGRNYNCNTMSQVWMVAKCVNFIHNDAFVTTDGFYPFIDMAGIAADDVAGGSEGALEADGAADP